MKVEYRPYQAKRIVNKYKHADGPWFWNRYSAKPYIGCQFACDYCYERSSKYSGMSANDFGKIIKVKTNAAELLDRELEKLPKDVIALGDYQPAELKYRLSRRMLEVALKHSFPVVIIEKSPLILRDIDLLVDLSRKSWLAVVFSINTAGDGEFKRVFERNAPSVSARFRAMEELAKRDILAGTALMPIIPYLLDSENNLRSVILKTKDCGGSFVIAGGLTLSKEQKPHFFEQASIISPEIALSIDNLYLDHQAFNSHEKQVGRKVRKICQEKNIDYRLKRYIPDDSSKVNKQVAEKLYLKSYNCEIDNASDHKVWAYRKAAWAIDDLETNIAELVNKTGSDGLRSIPGIGIKLAAEIRQLVES